MLGDTGAEKKIGTTSDRREDDKPPSAKVPPGPAAALITPTGGACQSDRCCPKVGVLREADGSGGATAELPGSDLGPGPFRGRLQFPCHSEDAGGHGPLRGSIEFREPTFDVEDEVQSAPEKIELSEAAIAALAEFPRDMFVFPAGETWPPQRPGFLDVFSGERGVAAALARKGHWSLCVDLAHGPGEDVMDPKLQRQLKQLVSFGAFRGAGGGPVCTSFSTAITPPVRSSSSPYGLESASDKMKIKIKEGNQMALWFFSFLEFCLRRGLQIWMENPATSFMFRLPEWQTLLQRWPKVQPWLVDYCRYGTRWRKRTKFYTDGPLGGRRDLCRCGKPHQLLRGRSATHKKSWTAVAQPYPKGICEELASNYVNGCLLQAVAPTAGRPSDAAFAGEGRIGEASNPGPRRPPMGRTGYLDDVTLVEPKTLPIQTRVWNDFSDWLNSQLSAEAVDSVLKHFGLLAQVLKEYGCHLYGEGKSLFGFRHLVVYTQQSFVGAKPYLQCCWDLVSKWEICEPPTHRVPIPEPVAKAIIACAILWGWRRFASVVGISYFGISRPGEPLRAERRHLILPSDLLQSDCRTAYVRIDNPKSRRRGLGKVQHLCIEMPSFVSFLEGVYHGFDRREPLLRCSASAFRRRWDAVIAALAIPATAHLTPGGLRGGGCVSSFQKGTAIPLLLWRMRLRHQQTLENYLQEAVAESVLPGLPSSTRDRIAALASLFEVLLAMRP